ncbi:MAG: N-acetyl-gamma-glutamyl-phosphate reductase [Clostridia bacterium]|nr:N-acetyl-gamma-glutamyl-phosphate reductase [Clostridia bacterium]
MIKVFIDGSSGTTGLNIKKRLGERNDISLITLDEEHRKDPEAKKKAIFESDVTFLCLPDDAAREAVALAGDADTVIIDTSTAHRTAEGWTYGFAELEGQREKIASSKRIANPGCHASGFISLVAPLVSAGIIGSDASLSCFSLTGYSGGGKKMIAQYEDPQNAEALMAPSMYALTQSHKHLPEMATVCSLEKPPVFCPVVSSFYSGMQVVVPLNGVDVAGGIEDIKRIYASVYGGKIVKYVSDPSPDGFLSAGEFSGRDDMQISVLGNDERITLVSRFDNLGKGACGAAIQNMNIALSLPEGTGLILPEENK